jgi:hypothetical protein
MQFNHNALVKVTIFEDALGRELLDSEKNEVYKFIDNLSKTLARNSMLQNEEDIKIGDEIVKKLLECFPSKIYVKRIPNEYCNDYCCVNRPWLKVTTEKGVIKIGWRKRVIVIDWGESDITHNGTELFKEENVTTWDTGVHAWGYSKAKEYLEKLYA